MKKISLSAAAILALGVALSAPAYAAHRHPTAYATQQTNATSGVDDGSGYWGPGTRSGGPVGGLPNSN